jgi:hypothetical protein
LLTSTLLACWEAILSKLQASSSRVVFLVLVGAAMPATLVPLPAEAVKQTCPCPSNLTNDFYANPTVDRSSCLKDKSYAPTGVASPAVCSYATLTAAMSAANAGLNYASSTRVISAGGTPAAPAVFGAETFPLLIPCGVSLTTTDDPALGGGGFNPASAIILFNSSIADHAITLRGPISGFTVQNAGASTGSALTCHTDNASVDTVRLDGLNGSLRLTTGLLVAGACSGTFSKIEVRNFSGQGVLVNSTSPDTAEFVYIDLHHNQIGFRALAGNVVIRQTGQLILTESRIHDNTGDGVVLGDQVDQTGIVTALIENTVIDKNDIGLLVQQTDTTAKSTHWILFGSDIVENRGTGLYAYTSFPTRHPNSGVMINGNVIGTNGWAVDACVSALNSPPPGSAAETASQVLFNGVFPASAEATQACAAYGDAGDVVGCNFDFAAGCVWNSGAPTNKCRPAWDISTRPPQTGQPCTDTDANTIAGYHRNGPENEDVRVGVVAANGAWVKAAADHFLTSAFEQHADWTDTTNGSFASNIGTVCSPAPVKCPVAPPVVPPIAP